MTQFLRPDPADEVILFSSFVAMQQNSLSRTLAPNDPSFPSKNCIKKKYKEEELEEEGKKRKEKKKKKKNTNFLCSWSLKKKKKKKTTNFLCS